MGKGMDDVSKLDCMILKGNRLTFASNFGATVGQTGASACTYTLVQKTCRGSERRWRYGNTLSVTAILLVHQ